VAVLGCAAVLGLVARYAAELPPVESLRDYNPSLVTRVLGADGSVIGEFFVERRVIIPLASIPKQLQDAFIAAEDASFFAHHGLDLKAVARAMVRNVLAGGVVQGGSTITQQVARNMFLSSERRLARKIKEAILAWRIEKHFTKEDILGLYLNHIYLGQGAYGVQAAALTYFGRPVGQLNALECAVLAGLPKAPNTYSPAQHPDRALKRAGYVLSRMVDTGVLTRAQAQAAAALPLRLQKARAAQRGAFFLEYVRRTLERTYGVEAVHRGGLEVRTTLDPRLQAAAETAVREGLREIDKRRGWRGPLRRLGTGDAAKIEALIAELDTWPVAPAAGDIVPAVVREVGARAATVRVGPGEGVLPLEQMRWVFGQGREDRLESPRQVLRAGDLLLVRVLAPGAGAAPARVALEQDPEVEGSLLCQDVRTGAVLAMVGGFDFGRNQYNRALQARRQPGSAFKPFIYAAALESGSWTPASIIDDSPIEFENTDEAAKVKVWRPSNFEDKFFGPTRLRVALNHSRNVVTIKLLQAVGVQKVIAVAQRMGVASPLAPDLTLALGSSSVTLQELTTAYGAIADDGVRHEPLTILSVRDRTGRVLEENAPTSAEVLGRDTAAVLTNMLQTVVSDGTGWKVKELGRPVAGKTGTTNDYVDAWFMGFTPDIVTGVWVGLDRRESLGWHETGSRAAIPIWLSFMTEAVAGRPVTVFPVPPGVVFAKIDPDRGVLAPPESPDAVVEVFREGTVPTAVAPRRPSREGDFYRFDL
ncbi:MAG TPA: PBP1A family penicillin-binding protein, partial [bacterium]